jgi:hypothetical protein
MISGANISFGSCCEQAAPDQMSKMSRCQHVKNVKNVKHRQQVYETGYWTNDFSIPPALLDHEEIPRFIQSETYLELVGLKSDSYS